MNRVGIDTIKASVALDPSLVLSVACFDAVSQYAKHDGTTVEKWVILSNPEETEPRITFYPKDHRLLCEVSLPKLITGTNERGLLVRKANALEQVDSLLESKLVQSLPPIKTWSIRRVDYVVGWQVDDLMLAYISAIGKRDLPRYDKIFYRTGVSWLTKSRRINLYDKYAQDGTGRGLLRCEIQNRWGAISYMARKWFNIPTTVESFMSGKIASYVMGHFLAGLNVDNLPPVADDFKLQAIFGGRWAQAKTYRQLINDYGVTAYRSGQMSRSSYYRYKNELGKHGLLGNDSVLALPPLYLE